MTDTYVTYAHKDQPTGPRFRGLASDPVPIWATNVQVEDDTPKNWLGYPPHPTDTYVHWSSRDPIGDMTKYRAAYDLLAAYGPEALTALETLIDAAVTAEADRQAELAAGPDL